MPNQPCQATEGKQANIATSESRVHDLYEG